MSEAVQASLDALQREGADRRDPVRFHYMQTLSRRMQSQPEPVRQILARKLEQALADYLSRMDRDPSASKVVSRLPKVGDTPLADLNRYIQSRTQSSQDELAGEDDVGTPDLKSVRRFSEVWSKIAAENQVEQAIGRGPENAGPLNSHMLMLRSLTMMRDLSPEYLRRFLSQAESLLWLEQINKQYALSATKPARRGRSGK